MFKIIRSKEAGFICKIEVKLMLLTW